MRIDKGRRFTTLKRDFLIRHIDGAQVPLPEKRVGKLQHVPHGEGRVNIIATKMVEEGLLEWRGRRDGTHATVITQKGREVLGRILADHADALFRAGYDMALSCLPIGGPILRAAAAQLSGGQCAPSTAPCSCAGGNFLSPPTGAAHDETRKNGANEGRSPALAQGDQSPN
jgi:hypothetical protein